MADLNSGNPGFNTGNHRLVAEYTPVRAAGVRQENRYDKWLCFRFYCFIAALNIHIRWQFLMKELKAQG
jgi:hypothetical protein